GYKIIPVNPRVKTVFGEQAYRSLLDIPKEIRIDLVDIFRRSENVSPIVDEAIERGVGGIWMQQGIVNEEAAARARGAGIAVVMDACVAVIHSQLPKRRPPT